MSFSVLVVLLLIFFSIFVSICSYNLGKRKTSTPKMAAVIGFVIGFVPILAMIYLAILLLKKDVNP
ncbi:hypothetical protein [Neptunicella marina]|uniref:Uncharacterized protein n=1 Tax=Neptunicella marina TaxID=2125989 RepID=A0A8J6IUR8_9ALTE|nr:hypothetical protein [Neptunicella marina]MBC3766215.1 hypothetical protein [Neptunicella marina]